MFFDYPKAAHFGRIVPKSKIYEHGKVTSRLKDKFVDQVDKIVWTYKLAPETINLRSTKSVPEIQVFELRLREPSINADVLKAIDKAIPFPIIFELVWGGKRKLLASYKRLSEAGTTKWVSSEPLAGEWVDDKQVERTALPLALDLAGLYEQLIAPLLPVEAADQKQSIRKRIERQEAINAQRREVDKIAARLKKEKQFKKKVAINAELRNAKKHLQSLANDGVTQTNNKAGSQS